MSVTLSIYDKSATRLRLQIDNPSGNTVSYVMRTDANGSHTLRVASGTFPSTAQQLILPDYEYAMVRQPVPVIYTAYSPTNVALGTVQTTAGVSGLLSLTVPLRPDAGMALNDGQGAGATVVISWNDTRANLATVHQIVGRSDPVVILHPTATRTGTLQITCPDLATAQRLERTLAQPYVFMLRQSDQNTLDVYFVPTAIGLTHGDDDSFPTTANNYAPERQWTVSVDFTEVAWPTGYTVPITVWTFNDVAASYGDFQAVAAEFATFADLLERVT